jgi:voltage-gated potassium channel Kch
LKRKESTAAGWRSGQQALPFIDQVIARIAGILFAIGCLVLIGYGISAGATWAAAILSAAMVVGGINAIMRRQ